MRFLRMIFLIGGGALLLGSAMAAVGFAQLRQQPLVLRQLWPFGQQQQPAPLAPEAPEDGTKRPLVARYVAPTIDINTCTLSQLQSLPGVDASLGAHIMAGRPYQSFQDLERDGIPLNVVSRLRGKINFGPRPD